MASHRNIGQSIPGRGTHMQPIWFGNKFHVSRKAEAMASAVAVVALAGSGGGGVCWGEGGGREVP